MHGEPDMVMDTATDMQDMKHLADMIIHIRAATILAGTQ
jgi:hypothetical protein